MLERSHPGHRAEEDAMAVEFDPAKAVANPHTPARPGPAGATVPRSGRPPAMSTARGQAPASLQAQAVRIPRDLKLPGKEALIHKEGDRLIIKPVPPPTLLAVLATLDPLDETFPDIDDRPAEPTLTASVGCTAYPSTCRGPQER